MKLLSALRNAGRSPSLFSAPPPAGPNRQARRERHPLRFGHARSIAHRRKGRVVSLERDRWDWRPTQRPPQMRRADSRRRDRLAKASRKANR